MFRGKSSIKYVLLMSVLVSHIVYAENIAHVSISGNSSIPIDALKQNLTANDIVEGQPLDREKLGHFRQQVVEHYHYAYYYNAKVDTVVKARANGEADIEVIIHEFKRQSPQIEDPLVADRYADVDVDSTQQEDKTPVAKISLGLGYGTKGVVARANFVARNFWGSDASVGLKGVYNKDERQAVLSYSKPNVISEGVRFDGTLFYRAIDNTNSRIVSPYRRRSYGASATLSVPMDKESHFYAGLRYTVNRLTHVRPEYSRALYLNSIKQKDWDFTTRDIDFMFGWKYSTFNKKYLPTKGLQILLDNTISLPNSDNLYYKLNLVAEAYLPLNTAETWLISGKVSLGHAGGMHNRKVPFYENYTAGGPDTLRGFADGSVGPRARYSRFNLNKVYPFPFLYTEKSEQVVGGDRLAAGSISLVFPSFFVPQSYRHDIRTSFFVDVARVWDSRKIYAMTSDGYASKKTRISAGLSIQWHFLGGVLSASYAVPIKKYRGDKLEPFQLNISGRF